MSKYNNGGINPENKVGGDQGGNGISFHVLVVSMNWSKNAEWAQQEILTQANGI